MFVPQRFEEMLKKALGDGDNLGGLEQKMWRKRKAHSLGESKVQKLEQNRC